MVSTETNETFVMQESDIAHYQHLDGHHTVRLSDGSSYSGYFQKGRPHGKGKFTRVDGSTYEGDWVNGKEHGHGIEHYLDEEHYGDVYEGGFANGKKNGTGRYIWANGDTHEGEYVDGERHGPGVSHYPNGNYYKGNFDRGFKDGVGTYFWGQSGNLYKGEWKRGTPCGYGVKQYANGNVYEGYFSQGRKNGKGKEVRYKGAPLSSSSSSTAVKRSDIDPKDVYEGEWSNDLPQGPGVVQYANGDTYVGEFMNGEKHGHGTYTWMTTKGRYEGEWQHGKPRFGPLMKMF